MMLGWGRWREERGRIQEADPREGAGREASEDGAGCAQRAMGTGKGWLILGQASGVVTTYYSSSSSRGKLHVVSSSRRQIGRPKRMDMDLSAARVRCTRGQHRLG